MSDTRDEAEQDMVAAGMASGMEDSLGSSLSSSFSIPALIPKPSQLGAARYDTPPESEADPEPPAEPVEGMDEWKSTYEEYLSQWHAESAEAREKAHSTRQRIEAERAAESKAAADKAAAERKDREGKEKEKERQERLRLELEGRTEDRKKGKIGSRGEETESRVKEAWEMVKGVGEGEGDNKEVVTDGRGVLDQDVKAGQANTTGHDGRPKIKQTAYDPTTSTEPMPPSMQDPVLSPSHAKPSSSGTESRYSTTSHSWVEVSGSPSSAEDLSPPASGSGFSNEDMMNIPESSSRVGKSMTDPVPKDVSTSGLSRDDAKSTAPASRSEQPNDRSQSHRTPPSQPPSLTLSLFTTPSHLTFSRIIAVIGINLFLPFVNGVMLGLGEIFSREAVKVGRIWWREGRSLFRSSRPVTRDRGGWDDPSSGGQDDSFAGGRGIAGVGLSGSGGFP